MVEVRSSVFDEIRDRLCSSGLDEAVLSELELNLGGVVLLKGVRGRAAGGVGVPVAAFRDLEDQLRLAGLHEAMPTDHQIAAADLVLRRVTRKPAFRQNVTGVTEIVETISCLICGRSLQDVGFTRHIKIQHGLTRREYHGASSFIEQCHDSSP